MPPPPILGSPPDGDVSISPGTAHGSWHQWRGTLHLICLLAVLLLPATARAALDIQAKAVKTESNEDEEIWAIRISLRNTGSAPLGPLSIQYRYSGFSEFDSDGKPEGPLEHKERTIKQVVAVLAPGEKASVDSPGMNFVGERNHRRLAKGMIQSIRVRAWQNGKLVGEFAEKGGKAADVEWPLNPPPVPEGAEAGSGPWLLLEKDHADFSGISLGASAAEVLKMLKTLGPGKIDAKPEPLHGHPLRMSSADLPGVTFGFDAAKRKSTIEITNPSRLKLNGKFLQTRSSPFRGIGCPAVSARRLPAHLLRILRRTSLHNDGHACIQGRWSARSGPSRIPAHAPSQMQFICFLTSILHEP